MALTTVNLRETRVQSTATRTTQGSANNLRCSASSGGTGIRGSILLARQGLDELALLTGALKEGEQNEALDEGEHVDGSTAGHLFVELGRNGVVLGDGEVAIDPSKVDAAQVYGLAFGRREARGCIDGQSDAVWMGENQVSGGRERCFFIRVGRRSRDDIAAAGDGLPKEQQRVLRRHVVRYSVWNLTWDIETVLFE